MTPRELGELEYSVVVGLGGKRHGEDLDAMCRRVLQAPGQDIRRRLAAHALLGATRRAQALQRAAATLAIEALPGERAEAKRLDLNRQCDAARKGLGLE